MQISNVAGKDLTTSETEIGFKISNPETQF